MKKINTDRRTIYTVNTIKDSFLKLIEQQPYTQIAVTQLCRTAEITRSTFYLHFDNLTDVLNAVLDDALLFNQDSDKSIPTNEPLSIDFLKENESLLPACQRIGDSTKYQHLLMDPTLSDYIIGRIILHEHDRAVPALQKRTGLNKEDAELFFTYSIHGSFAINKRHHFIKDDSWYHDLELLNRFSSTGYKVFKNK